MKYETMTPSQARALAIALHIPAAGVEYVTRAFEDMAEILATDDLVEERDEFYPEDVRIGVGTYQEYYLNQFAAACGETTDDEGRASPQVTAWFERFFYLG